LELGTVDNTKKFKIDLEEQGYVIEMVCSYDCCGSLIGSLVQTVD